MLRKIIAGIIVTLVVFTAGAVVGVKYGSGAQRKWRLREQRNTLVRLALRAEQFECRVNALDVQLPLDALHPVYVVADGAREKDWFVNPRFACQGLDHAGKVVQIQYERPPCNRALIEAQWQALGEFSSYVIGTCLLLDS